MFQIFNVGRNTRKTYLHAEFPKGLWCKECANLSNNCTIESAEYNLVTFMKDTVREDDIDGCTQTFDDLDLQNRAFHLRQVHQAIAHPLLSQVHK